MTEILTTMTLVLQLMSSQIAYAETLPEPPVLSIEEKIVQELGPEFLAIGKCESGLRQFNADGSVLISRTSDIGLFQINQVHWQTAKKMGIDINTVDGNIAYAKYLKERGGTQPWYMSRHCWSKV